VRLIDPHLHLFDLAKGDYHWLNLNNPPFWPDKKIINQNFSESDITPEECLTREESSTNLDPLILAGFVHIEAGFDNQQPWREIAWLEQHCQKPFKAVAGIDLTLPAALFNQQLAKLNIYTNVVGCRYILDEQAFDLLTDPSVVTNLASLAQQKLSFDLQMAFSDVKAIQALSSVLESIPELSVIINHAGQAPYWDETLSKLEGKEKKLEWQQWQAGIKIISSFQQCAIKCSGWLKWMDKVLSHCLDCFGDNRVMLASNFPLCLFHGEYTQLWQNYQQLAPFNIKNKENNLTALFYQNAKNWYRF
jgi:L-fuconolactonase